MNMFKPVKATSVKEYLAAVPPDRKDLIEFFHALIQKTVPSLKPHLAYNMIGYGSFPYVNYKKELVEWPIIALANQKQYVSLYVCALHEETYLAEAYAKKLGNVSVGKSCIRFKKREDVDVETLKTVLKMAAKKPGLVSAAMKKAS